MKKYLAIVLAVVMMFSLTACGGEKSTNTATDEKTSSQSSEAEKDATTQESSGGIQPAQNGEITLSKENIAVVVKGKAVPMPYKLGELEAAGVPVSDDFREDELASGDSFSLNLYLDENDDYLLIPGYYNAGDNAVTLNDAEAKTISMVTYASEPVDQGVSLLGVTFGMKKSNIKALLGEPMSDDGSSCQWQVAVSDADYVGNFSIYFVGEGDDAGASEVRLDFMQW